MDIEMTCPHQKTVKIVDMLGVLCYMHIPGDDSCTLMNNFSTSSDRILTVMLKKKGFVLSPETRAALAISGGQVESFVFGELATRKDQELKELLIFVIDAYSSFTNSILYFRELINTFGQTAVSNIMFLTQQDFSPLLDPSTAKDHKKMQDLRLSSSLQKIQSTANDIRDMQTRLTNVIDTSRKTRLGGK